MSDLSTELKYCEDYCPIYNTLKSYNESHQHQIMCLTAMCAHITEICELNREEGARMSTVFQAIGIVATAGICLFVICIIKEFLEEKIEYAKWQYKYKHRFDKSPLAKCYCQDCIYCIHGRCTLYNGMGVAENWFCWNAGPTKYDPEKK